MPDIKVEVEPGEVGLDGGRLERIEQHFRDYVDDGRLPGWLTVVTRHGKVAYLAHYGMRDKEAGLPVETDTIWRFYSMTKPITSVAVMMLFEQGAFDLRDPVMDFIPSFADGQVFVGGTADAPLLEPVRDPVRIWQLLTHTSGLSYGQTDHPVDELYRRAGLGRDGDPIDLAARAERWGRLPLLFHPGTRWNYSASTDVLGRFVEVVSGQSLDAFFAEHILGPLGMNDTAFVVADDKRSRVAQLYEPDPATGRATPAADARPDRSSPFLSGGGGLLGTATDYHRFTQMLLGGGELDGVRLLGPRTLGYMTTNQLPNGSALEALGRVVRNETSYEGMGFGLGFSVVVDPQQYKVVSSPGEFAWGGAASTCFWVDPREQLTALFFTQLRPSSTWPIRPRLHQLIYQAIVEPRTS